MAKEKVITPVWVELNEKLEPNEEFNGITKIVDGKKIGLIATIKIWESASSCGVRYGSLKVSSNEVELSESKVFV